MGRIAAPRAVVAELAAATTALGAAMMPVVHPVALVA